MNSAVFDDSDKRKGEDLDEGNHILQLSANLQEGSPGWETASLRRARPVLGTASSLVHVEIPPDDEVSRVSRADLLLEHIGRGMEFASSQRKKRVV
jgi:hypothetical protein